MTYEAYKDMCKKHNIENPYKTDEDYYRAYPQKVEEAKPPKVIKTKQPTLGLNIVDSHKIRIAKSDKPNEPKPKRSYSKRLSDWKRPNKSGRVMVAPKISYHGMSADEIKAHKAKLARDWRARTEVKERAKKYCDLTDDEKKVLSEKKKKYYQANKERICKKAKEARANATPEQKQISVKRLQKWREKQREAKID